MALRPEIEECVGCFVCFDKNNLFFFNPTFLVAPISVLQLKHHNLLEPRASCAKNVQNENSVCGPAMWMEGGGWWWLVGGRSYLILEPVWWKPQCAAAALLSFHCCSVARGAHPGTHQAAQRQTRGKFFSTWSIPVRGGEEVAGGVGGVVGVCIEGSEAAAM